MSTPIDDLPVRHSYTMGDLRQLAAAAVSADRLMASDVKDRYDTAWSAIAEHLCTAQEPPERQELVRVGWQAIYRAVRDARRERGYADGYDSYTADGPTMPRFVMWWGRGVTPSHEGRIVEKVAAQQVMAALVNPTYRDAVIALAVHGDYQKAADALGINYNALTVRLTTARRQFLERWHEDETPYRPRRTDRRVQTYGAMLATHCKADHEYTPENTYVRHRMLRGKPNTSRVCRTCEHERSVSRHRARTHSGGAG